MYVYSFVRLTTNAAMSFPFEYEDSANILPFNEMILTVFIERSLGQCDDFVKVCSFLLLNITSADKLGEKVSTLLVVANICGRWGGVKSQACFQASIFCLR